MQKLAWLGSAEDAGSHLTRDCRIGHKEKKERNTPSSLHVFFFNERFSSCNKKFLSSSFSFSPTNKTNVTVFRWFARKKTSVGLVRIYLVESLHLMLHPIGSSHVPVVSREVTQHSMLTQINSLSTHITSPEVPFSSGCGGSLSAVSIRTPLPETLTEERQSRLS